MTHWRDQLEADGFAFLRGALAPADVARALAEWDAATRAPAARGAVLTGESGPAYGARNVLDLWPGAAELARVPVIAAALEDVLGTGAGIVRGLYFDKPPGHSWALPWHKDYSLAVKEHRGGDTFTKPTFKAGVPHVIAPQSVLDRMLTLRVHLDAATPNNGPLRVIPGSHRAYHERADAPRAAVALECAAGDVLLMRPLLTHASGHSAADAGHRRIVHLECAADAVLPDGYEWKWFVSVAELGA
ncbi:MAG: phytanoyl-CoA dioxygenase family protein [Planctomycetes bacterium]|nr:phytanoyl-CoA dioxygenase family protein [Planctomycetota bacterium]